MAASDAAPSPLVQCHAKAQAALQSLLANDVAVAEATLRAALIAEAQPPEVAVACLLGNLGLCALHSGRPHEASEAIRHSLTLLPAADFSAPGKAEPAVAWVPLARAQ
eukprot:842479-Prymnesium_polylepis.1